jgi:hypothetical protein
MAAASMGCLPQRPRGQLLRPTLFAQNNPRMDFISTKLIASQ